MLSLFFFRAFEQIVFGQRGKPMTDAVRQLSARHSKTQLPIAAVSANVVCTRSFSASAQSL
jgi:hypothetical protein